MQYIHGYIRIVEPAVADLTDLTSTQYPQHHAINTEFGYVRIVVGEPAVVVL